MSVCFNIKNKGRYLAGLDIGNLNKRNRLRGVWELIDQ